jgi:uncharacterized protein (DUF362 family)
VATATDGGPANGQKVAANVMIAGRDRVAVDVVGLAPSQKIADQIRALIS